MASGKINKINKATRCKTWIFAYLVESILENGGDGISFEATDGKNYYFVYEPTDVQWRSPEEYSEYKKVRDAVTISFGNLQNIQ